jgi:hypothetical protein
MPAIEPRTVSVRMSLSDMRDSQHEPVAGATDRMAGLQKK